MRAKQFRQPSKWEILEKECRDLWVATFLALANHPSAHPSADRMRALNWANTAAEDHKERFMLCR